MVWPCRAVPVRTREHAATLEREAVQRARTTLPPRNTPQKVLTAFAYAPVQDDDRAP